MICFKNRLLFIIFLRVCSYFYLIHVCNYFFTVSFCTVHWCSSWRCCSSIQFFSPNFPHCWCFSCYLSCLLWINHKWNRCLRFSYSWLLSSAISLILPSVQLLCLLLHYATSIESSLSSFDILRFISRDTKLSSIFLLSWLIF